MCAQNCKMSVSYTHLDVYKRQHSKRIKFLRNIYTFNNGGGWTQAVDNFLTLMNPPFIISQYYKQYHDNTIHKIYNIPVAELGG